MKSAPMKNNPIYGTYAIAEFLYGITDLCTLLVDGAPEPVLAIDNDHRIVLLNAAGERWLQRPRREVLNKKLWEAWPGAGEDGLLQYLDGVLHQKRSEGTHRTSHGGKHFLWRALPMTDKFGALHGVICMLQDVTAQLRADNRIRELEKALQEKEFLLTNRARMAETIIDASNDMIIVLDRELRFCAANKTYQQFSGMSHEVLMGRPLTAIVPEVVGSEFIQKVGSAFQGNAEELKRAPCVLRDGYCDVFITPLTYGELVYGVLVVAHLVD
jgi:PAS domain S-box-containing protein